MPDSLKDRGAISHHVYDISRDLIKTVQTVSRKNKSSHTMFLSVFLLTYI